MLKDTVGKSQIIKKERKRDMEKRLLKKVRKEMVKICLLMVLILLSTNIVSAKMKEHVDEELYNQACDKALEVIRPLNVENKEVNIRDCYVVLNMLGEFDGYSLGYFVDEKPYGYAIYSAENNSVREFVFCPDVENMYKKLEEKAKQSDIINENELINGIVYEGGIDYCTYDVDGGCIDYCDNNNDVDMVEVDVKKMKKKINEKRSLYTKEGYYLCDSIRHSDISWGNYYTVPDAGLAMITQEYIKDINKRKYGCTLVSATGIINWMNRNNGSVLKTYDTLYNWCISKKYVSTQEKVVGLNFPEIVQFFNNY